MSMQELILIDCTFRDGGYYNSWDFSPAIIKDYLIAMEAAGVDYVELGFRSFKKDGSFKGACAYTTDAFLRSLNVPSSLKIGVMMNASELVTYPEGAVVAARKMFSAAHESPVKLVRFACHLREFKDMLPACDELKAMGYSVGINLMQVADRTDEEIKDVARAASEHPLDVLYFADSLGSMDPEQTSRIISLLREEWSAPLGIHTHDNMGKAVANSLKAIEKGVTWIDATVTGMGRGPGNAQTEYILIELASRGLKQSHLTPLLSLIREHFQPMKVKYGWGINPYYYIAGKYGVHPTYVQEMLADARFGEEDVLSVLEHLRTSNGKSFSVENLENGRSFYKINPCGTWDPKEQIDGREVLVLGSGPGVFEHKTVLESYIKNHRPFVITLNTQRVIDDALVDVRAACHPIRVLADSGRYKELSQPLVIPRSMLPENVSKTLSSKLFLDFGIGVRSGGFEFHPNYVVVPSPLVIAYALGIATSGGANRILLAGFDGYGADDPRTGEMNTLLRLYSASPDAVPIVAITPSRYDVPSLSVYSF